MLLKYLLLTWKKCASLLSPLFLSDRSISSLRMFILFHSASASPSLRPHLSFQSLFPASKQTCIVGFSVKQAHANLRESIVHFFMCDSGAVDSTESVTKNVTLWLQFILCTSRTVWDSMKCVFYLIGLILSNIPVKGNLFCKP